MLGCSISRFSIGEVATLMGPSWVNTAGGISYHGSSSVPSTGRTEKKARKHIISRNNQDAVKYKNKKDKETDFTKVKNYSSRKRKRVKEEKKVAVGVYILYTY